MRMSKPKFGAEVVKATGTNKVNTLPNKRPVSTSFNGNITPEDYYDPQAPEYNLDQYTMGGLLEELKKNLNHGPSWFIFLRNRHNQKIRIEGARIELLKSTIEQAIITNQSLINYKAEIFLSKQKLKDIIDSYYIETERNAVLKGIEFESKKVLTAKEAQKAINEIEAEKIANLKARAEINQMEAKTRQELMRADLMNKAIDNIDKFPPSLQTYIYRAIFNPGDKQEDDILLQDEVRDILKKEKEAAAKKADADARFRDEEVRAQRAKADNDELKFQRAKNKPRDI